jgi:hypothetical protein
LALSKSQKFQPVTNCSIEFDGVRYNINALPKEHLSYMLVKLNAMRMSADDLGMNLEISGFSVQDWIKDIKLKLEHTNRKDEENKLKVMEAKLTQMLSDEKKVELELGEIESFLKS